MINPDQIIHLQGIAYTKASLMEKCRQMSCDASVSSWEKDLYLFLMEWMAPSPYMVVHTSGSTSQPKPIKIRKEHMEASARATIAFLDLKPGDSALLCLPVAFIAGKMMLVRAMIGKLKLVYANARELTSIPPHLQFAAMVPYQVSGLLESKEGRSQLNHIEKLILGGSFISGALEQQLQTLKTKVWHTYGMTETITHIAMRKLNGPDTTPWFRPLAGILVSRSPADTLTVHAPHIGIDQLETNDLVILHPKFGFKITGRLDNVVVSGGLKLFPEKIEAKLQGLGIPDFFIGALPDKHLGERLVLFIEDPDRELLGSVIDIWKYIEHKLTGYEIPREIVFIPQFTRTTSAKLNRRSSIKKYVQSTTK